MSKIARTDLARIIGKRTLDVQDPQQLAREIAAYLLAEKRTADLESLLRDIMQYRTDHGVVEAVAIGAHPLGETVLQDVTDLMHREYPEATAVIVRERSQPELVGGVRVKMANQQLDMSVQSKLNTFKRLTASERNI
jgi:F0F1-type ATP synthase delta subunit